MSDSAQDGTGTPGTGGQGLCNPEEVTVLVVDDERDVSTFLSSVIKDAGMNALVANDGDTAHKLIHDAKPDLISLDLVMPGKSGIRLLHELRKHPDCARIPVVIVTGHAQDPDIRRPLEQVLAESSMAGPSLYLEKPVTARSYLEALCKVLKVKPRLEADQATRSQGLRKQLDDLLAGADEATLETVLGQLKERARGGHTEVEMKNVSSPATILIIDDEPDVAKYLERLFEDHGYRALTAIDGERGLDLARRQAPDLICLDISMPAPSGVRVYRELRGDPSLASIPVVMVTGVPRQFKEFISRRRQVPPPDGYLAKPFDPDELLATVSRLLAAGPTRPTEDRASAQP